MIITKEGNILKIDFGAGGYMGLREHAENLSTGRSVSLLTDGTNNTGIKTEVLCNSLMSYTHSDVSTINGALVDTNKKFYDSLVAML